MPRNKSFKPSRKWSNAVRRVINKQTEVKMKATNSGPTAVLSLTPGIVIPLNRIADGASDGERIGTKIKGIGLKMTLVLQSKEVEDLLVRIIVLSCDDGEFTAITDKFLLNGSNVPAAPLTALGNQFQNIIFALNRKQYKVLYHRIVKLAGTGSTEAAEAKIIRKFIKFNHSVQFPDTTAIDANRNNLRYVCIPVDAKFDAETSVESTLHTMYYYTDL